MSEEQFIIFKVPKDYVNPDDMISHDEIKMPWKANKSLKYYYMDTRYTHHLGTKALRFTVRKSTTREHVRTSYIPKPGEVFLFVPAGKSVS